NPLDEESAGPHVRGFVIEELSPIPSNWRSRGTLDDYLREWSIPGVQGIDTRALTKHLRSRGAMQGCVTTEDISVEEAIERARNAPPMSGSDFVKEVTPNAAYEWDPNDTLSRRWTIVKGEGASTQVTESGEVFDELSPIKHHIVVYDLGLKLNQLRRLRQEGFKVHVVPADTPAAEVLALKPDGVFLSNGPGDPEALSYVHESLRGLIGKTPIFGICLGHQMLGHALGGKTFKLKFGHRGGNQPVKDLRTGKVTITSQNHGFAVDPDSLPSNVEVTHINLNDQTVEGLAHKELPIFSVQYHPEASPGPNDASYFFSQFAKLIEDHPTGR
ncbi:MAG TPA: glutamine-hydrolyzing carbamoyl-phosphate synthase small subunit, partial [Chthoniobacteraceae bacterium]|nr:glutamine-hydrolyzing carbamoyl-phosphate synthase small subunit [Chthoniobacteraceae bacterium]